MSVATKVIVAGTVTDVTRRSGTSKVTGELWEINTALIIGGGCVAEVTWRAGESVPKEGEKVQLIARVGVYRDDDSLEFVKYN